MSIITGGLGGSSFDVVSQGFSNIYWGNWADYAEELLRLFELHNNPRCPKCGGRTKLTRIAPARSRFYQCYECRYRWKKTTHIKKWKRKKRTLRR